MKNIARLIDVAMGREKADLVIKNAQIYNSFTASFSVGQVLVDHGYVAAVSSEGDYEGVEEFEADGAFLTPGLCDGHVHIESSMAAPLEFCKTISALGTTTIIADAHEIANAAGLAGLTYFLEATEDAPVNVFMMLPSCVPASPLEGGGAILTAEDLAPFLAHPRVLGLGEMMNFPGVIHKDPEVLAKIQMAQGRFLDGHSPGLSGASLAAYASCGINSDHECITASEATERLGMGISIMLRQGSIARNLLNLLPAVNEWTAPFCQMCTDDRNPEDLFTQGHINYLLHLAVNQGKMEPNLALRLATINTPLHFALKGYGAIAPGYRADMVLFPNLIDFEPSKVWQGGRLVGEYGRSLWEAECPADESTVRVGLNLAPVKLESFRVKANGRNLRVIGLIPGEAVTEHLVLTPEPVKGEFIADPAADLVKVAVLERYRGSGEMSVGFLKGLGLKSGALASTVAHDSHNLVVAGVNDEDLLLATEEIKRIGGGLVVVDKGQVLGNLPLPLGGILSDRPMTEIAAKMAELRYLTGNLGLKKSHEAFMALAFMSLSVIPKLKLTEKGLVDVEKFHFVPLVF